MRAVLAVDVQNDFLPGGALGVADGDAVIEPLVKAAKADDVRLVVASRDLHPPDHVSFRDQGGPWPDHCVADTEGSKLAPAIAEIADIVVDKGTLQHEEAYSAFHGTGLAETLREHGITKITVGGLTTDYCVRTTVLDGLENGFEVEVLAHASRPVDVEPGDGERALEEMKKAGARILESEDRPPRSVLTT